MRIITLLKDINDELIKLGRLKSAFDQESNWTTGQAKECLIEKEFENMSLIDLSDAISQEYTKINEICDEAKNQLINRLYILGEYNYAKELEAKYKEPISKKIKLIEHYFSLMVENDN